MRGEQHVYHMATHHAPCLHDIAVRIEIHDSRNGDLGFCRYCMCAIALWRITPDIETIGPRIICAIACLAAIRAARKGGYFWVAAFGGIAVIFNPFVPDMVSRIAIFGLYLVFASTALLGLAMLNSGRYHPAPISLAVPTQSGARLQATRSDFMKFLLRLFEFVVGCHHRQMSRVFTIKKRTYRVCFECGQEFDAKVSSI